VECPRVVCYVSSISAIDVHEFPVLYGVYSADDAKGLRLRCGYVDYFSLVMTIIYKKGTYRQKSNLLLFNEKMIFVFYDS